MKILKYSFKILPDNYTRGEFVRVAWDIYKVVFSCGKYHLLHKM